MPSGGQNKKWTDEIVETQLRSIAASIGHFPSNSELLGMGLGGLSNIVGKRGGLLSWSERLGIARVHSDSDTGWDGEKEFAALCRMRGWKVETQTVKAPFDLLIQDVMRVDVKAAKYAEYPPCRGWFYRLGKIPQADIIVFYQLDTGDFYSMPWWKCPRTNMTISRGGGKYAEFLNNWDLISLLIAQRRWEQADILSPKIAV